MTRENQRDTVSFAHQSEKEFALLLDYYHVRWVYEPRSFTLEWDDQGNPARQFTPDFYLPEHDLYVEVTTMRQKLITKKNRKVRLLKELYPDVKIKMINKRDVESLFLKYGLGSGST